MSIFVYEFKQVAPEDFSAELSVIFGERGPKGDAGESIKGDKGDKGDQGDPATNIVKSVNGLIDEVFLDAADVGADPQGSAAQALLDANAHTDAAVEGKADKTKTAGTFNFSGMTHSVTTSGSDNSFAIRVPFLLTKTAIRWRAVFKNYGDNFRVTGVYLGASSDALAPANYNYKVAPTSIGSMPSPDTDYATAWQTTPIAGMKNLVFGYGVEVAEGASINAGPMGVYKSNPSSTAASAAPTGGVEQLNGLLEARIEYEVAGHVPTGLVLGHSLNTNCMPVQPNGAINAWPQIFARKTGALISDISAYGSTADVFETPYSLERSGSIVPDTVYIWAMSNSINAGESFGQLVSHLIAIMNNSRARWPGVQFVVMLEPKRADIPPGDPREAVRVAWNNALRDPSADRSLGQFLIVDTDTVLSSVDNESKLKARYAHPDGNHQNYQGHLAVAKAVVDGDPSPIDKIYFDDKLAYVVGDVIPAKADKTYVDSQDALKADKTYVDSQDALKADKTYVDSQDALKADKTYVDSQDALKADKTYVDSQDALKVDRVSTNNRVYGTSSMGNQTSYQIASAPTAGTVPLRSTDGVLKVGNPVEGADAVPYSVIQTLQTMVETNFVNTLAAQNVNGVKTFAESPIVPNPTTATQIANKEYADTKLAKSGTDTIADGTVWTLGTAAGLKIGAGTNQRVGFYNVTPVSQAAATVDLGVVLSSLGIRAIGTAYPITTSGAVSTGALTTNNSIREVPGTISATATLTTASPKNQTVNAAAAAINITLPATTAAGYVFNIYRADANAGIVTVLGTINGNASGYVLTGQYKYVEVMSTATSGVWQIRGSN